MSECPAVVIPQQALVDVAALVCEALLGTCPSPLAAPLDGARVRGWISISGAWNGDVEVRLSHDLATRIAREMLLVDPVSADDAEVEDAVRELANMIGGNLKALLPAPCHLSLPAWEGARGGARADLTEVDLTQVDLTQVDLIQVDLIQADLIQAFALDDGAFEIVVRTRHRD